jgi:predicted acylesterase/phospholipase RssA
MDTADLFPWFSLARQPQAPLAPNGGTLTGSALAEWRDRFRPLLSYLERRDVVLVLSGGGMALPAHVGVLRVLELLSIKPRRIYGTSAGAVVGGLSAAGLASADIERVLLSISSPGELFGFAARHPGLRLVTGILRRTFLSPGLDEAGIYKVDRVEGYVARTLTDLTGRRPTLEELPIPFSCIACDIGYGDEEPRSRAGSGKVIFSQERTPDVELADAIGASMSIPGVLTPKRIGGRHYVDGGTVENLPVLTAYDDWRRRKRLFGRGLAIIAVELGSAPHALSEDTLADPISIVLFSGQLQERALTYTNLLACHRPRRGCTVIVVRPSVGFVELHEIEKMRSLMHAGYVAAAEQLAGEGFLDETALVLDDARTFLAESPGRA